MRRQLALMILLTSFGAASAGCAALPGSGPTGQPTSAASATASQPPANASPGTSPVPSVPAASAGTSPRPVSEVTSPAQAAAVVFASNPLFGSISQPLPDVIGQSTSYQAAQDGAGFTVSVMIGSGDCPAGCINQHTWNYTVSNTGSVTLVSEQGDTVQNPVDHGVPGNATVTVRLLAGPVCPVVRDPPDPSCADKPVANTAVVLRDPSGAQVATATSNDQGTITFSVPGGAYYVEPASAAGYMQAATAQAFSVPSGRNVTIALEYDTGIR